MLVFQQRVVRFCDRHLYSCVRKWFSTISYFQPALLVSNILVGILLLIEELRQAPASISSASVITIGPGNDHTKNFPYIFMFSFHNKNS